MTNYRQYFTCFCRIFKAAQVKEAVTYSTDMKHGSTETTYHYHIHVTQYVLIQQLECVEMYFLFCKYQRKAFFVSLFSEINFVNIVLFSSSSLIYLSLFPLILEKMWDISAIAIYWYLLAYILYTFFIINTEFCQCIVFTFILTTK